MSSHDESEIDRIYTLIKPFEDQYLRDHADSLPPKYDYEKAMEIAHKHPDLVSTYLPVFKEAGYGNCLDIISNCSDYARSLFPLFKEMPYLIEEYAKRALRLQNSDHQDKPLDLPFAWQPQDRISATQNPDEVKKQLAKITEIEERLSKILGNEKQKLIAKPFEGLVEIYLEKGFLRGEYMLIRILPTIDPPIKSDGKKDRPIHFFPIFLYIHHDGTASVDYSGHRTMYDKGYALIATDKLDEVAFVDALVKHGSDLEKSALNKALETTPDGQDSLLAEYVLGS